MAAPVGNTNVTDGKRWSGAIRRALHEYSDDRVSQGEALLEIAKGIVRDALAGDAMARKEIGERLDGKAAQSLMVAGDPEQPLRTVTRVELVSLDDGGTGKAPA